MVPDLSGIKPGDPGSAMTPRTASLCWPGTSPIFTWAAAEYMAPHTPSGLG